MRFSYHRRLAGCGKGPQGLKPVMIKQGTYGSAEAEPFRKNRLFPQPVSVQHQEMAR